MAQAFAKMYGAEKVQAHSAGSRPSGRVNPRAIAAMQELGYDLRKHESKSLQEIPSIKYDYVITMGCGDECPWIEANHREDWALPDPRNMEPVEFNQVRDEIAERVKKLLTDI